MNAITTHQHGQRQRQIRGLLDDYVRMYLDHDPRMATLFSDNFSGFTGSGDFLVKNREQWTHILQQEVTQLPDPLKSELLELALQDVGEDVVVATAFFRLQLRRDQPLSPRKIVRLVLVFHQEDEGWKIVHSGFSLPCQPPASNEGPVLQRLQQESEALQASQALYRQLTEDTPDVLWKVDSRLRLTYISPADERLRGFKADEVIGQSIFSLFTDEGAAAIRAEMQKRAAADPGSPEYAGFSIIEAQHRCKDGRLLWGEILSKPDRDADGQIVGYHGITREITQRKLRQDQVQQLAFRDTLTQLANRRQLMERLTQALLAGQRYHRCGAVLFLDLDNFKALNDAHGHSTGDLLLIEVAHRLNACVRALDTVARFGGDEFVVLLSELSTEGAQARVHAERIAENIRTSLALPYHLDVTHPDQTHARVEHHCTASIGVVVFDGHGAQATDVIDWADAAMYQAKTDGRNRVRFHSPAAV